jgi:hypothetical protein
LTGHDTGTSVLNSRKIIKGKHSYAIKFGNLIKRDTISKKRQRAKRIEAKFGKQILAKVSFAKLLFTSLKRKLLHTFAMYLLILNLQDK